MTKRPTVGHSFFEFAKFLRELLRIKVDLVFVPTTRRWDESLT